MITQHPKINGFVKVQPTLHELYLWEIQPLDSDWADAIIVIVSSLYTGIGRALV